VQLLKGAAPNISRVAILADTVFTWEQRLPGLSSAAKDLELTLLFHNVNGVKSETEFDSILSKTVEERADALFVFSEFVNNKYEKAILDFASANRLPSMCQNTSFIERGGLMYYYTDWSELVAERQPMSIRSSKARSLRTCRSSSPVDLSLSSM